MDAVKVTEYAGSVVGSLLSPLCLSEGMARLDQICRTLRPTEKFKKDYIAIMAIKAIKMHGTKIAK